MDLSWKYFLIDVEQSDVIKNDASVIIKAKTVKSQDTKYPIALFAPKFDGDSHVLRFMASCKRDLFTFCLFLLSCILAHIKCERPNVNGDKVATRIRGNDVELSSDNSCLPDSDTAVNGSVTDHADGVTVSTVTDTVKWKFNFKV